MMMHMHMMMRVVMHHLRILRGLIDSPYRKQFGRASFRKIRCVAEANRQRPLFPVLADPAKQAGFDGDVPFVPRNAVCAPRVIHDGFLIVLRFGSGMQPVLRDSA